jgi:hypothetical protein
MLGILALGAFCLAVPAAKAVPLQIAYGPVNTQPGNNGIGTLTTWAQSAIDAYNTGGYTGSPLPALGAFQFQILPTGQTNTGTIPPGWPTGYAPSTTSSLTLPLGGFNYIVLSWGGSNIPGDNGTADYLYYIGGTSGNFTFSRPDLAGGGLSGVTVWGPTTPPRVPDGGTTIALLGFGLLACVIFQHKMKFA